jgi:hypothetical protein
MSAQLLKEKKYPLNYPPDVLAVINALAFDSTNVKIAGSMALMSQQYAGDFDLFEVVKSEAPTRNAAVESFCNGFQNNIKKLMKLPDCYIGDIKCGVVPEWEVVKGDVKHGHVVGYDALEARRRLKQLEADGVISDEEAADAARLIKPSPTPEEFLIAQKEIRPQIVRWKPNDVLRGYVILRNGRRFTLAEGITSPTLSKIDAVSLVQNSRFTDFSCIYSFRWRSTILNDEKSEGLHEMKKNILYLESDGQYFKLSKRIFSLLKNTKSKLLEPLSEMFNGDLGRIYSIISDIDTMLFLLDNEGAVPLKRLQYEIGQFRFRLGNVYSTKRVNTDRVLDELVRLEKSPKGEMVRGLELLKNALSSILNNEAKHELEEIKLIPIPRDMLP